MIFFCERLLWRKNQRFKSDLNWPGMSRFNVFLSPFSDVPVEFLLRGRPFYFVGEFRHFYVFQFDSRRENLSKTMNFSNQLFYRIRCLGLAPQQQGPGLTSLWKTLLCQQIVLNIGKFYTLNFLPLKNIYLFIF